MREWMFGGEVRSHARRLVAECEGFLTGRLALECERSGGVAPGWMWFNHLAHGTTEDLAACESGLLPGYSVGMDVWAAPLAYLASELRVIQAETGATLDDIQRDVLVPLELRLAGRVDGWRMLPSDLVPVAVDALERFRDARRRDQRAAGHHPATA